MRKLDIRGCDLQTDQRVKLLALWQANQRGDDIEEAGNDWPVAAMVVVAVLWAVLVAALIKGGGF